MNKVVFLAEKPSVAKSLAEVVGATTKKEGFYVTSDERIKVTWAYGHLVQLAGPKSYNCGWDKWDVGNLPMIPREFMLRVMDDPGVKKQYNTIISLWKDCDCIVVATDAGREGELIFRYIYDYSKCQKPFKRLWISSLTNEAIQKGVNNLKNGEEYDKLYLAGKARAEADWLMGMNFTVAFTKKNTGNVLVSIGRVQTPTLGLIVNRFLEHTAFVPQAFYYPVLILEHNGVQFKARYFEDYTTRLVGQEILEQIGAHVECVSKSEKEKKENPPKLFDLSLLQQVCNRLYGLSAQDTLNIAQTLYEKKWLSYPRTDSNYLSNDFIEVLPRHFHFVGEVLPEYSTVCSRLEGAKISTIYIDDKKISDHHAIIPVINTGESLVTLSPNELKVYKLVCKQFIQAFMPVCVKNVQELLFVDLKKYFRASGTIIKEAGWRILNQKEENANEEEYQSLPEVQERQKVNVNNKTVVEGFTKKPPIHTESSLLKMMETAGREIEDEDLRSEMKDMTLGTPATRAGIIELLLKRGYIKREQTKLIPTEMGKLIYDSVKDQDFAKPDMTAAWEKQLAQIQKGEKDYNEFKNEIFEYIQRKIIDVKKDDFSPINLGENTSISAFGKCPVCGKPLKTFSFGIGCSGYSKENPQSCKFAIGKEVSKANLSDTAIKTLLSGGMTRPLKFVSKNGKPFEASLKLNNDHKIEFVFKDKN